MSTDFPVLARTRVSLRWGGAITGKTNYATIIISKEEASRFFTRLQTSKNVLFLLEEKKKKKKKGTSESKN